MIEWIWRRLFGRLDAYITERIVRFDGAMVDRKQIAPPPMVLALAGWTDISLCLGLGVN